MRGDETDDLGRQRSPRARRGLALVHDYLYDDRQLLLLVFALSAFVIVVVVVVDERWLQPKRGLLCTALL